ncbi:MAG: hypothetical protein QUU85_16805, partial [Candidatus Eisenbacteria bacterium]|nr:hypothetical protein [Candidatus Eisenbacteria bacterium]
MSKIARPIRASVAFSPLAPALPRVFALGRALALGLGLAPGLVVALGVALTFTLTIGAEPASASIRNFGYVYGSDVLNEGAVELEPWTTFRLGRERFYARVDHRLELEAGVTDRLQAAFYLNWTAIQREDAGGTRDSEFEWNGISLEWKYKLADPVAQPLGVALYVEPSFGPAESEIEGKLILDSRRGDWYGAFNAVFEHEWDYAAAETEREAALEGDLGICRFVGPAVAGGIEVRSVNEIPAGEGLESSVLFTGPVFRYAADSFWLTATVLAQIAAFEGKTKDGLDLARHERVEARLLLGV